MILIILKCVSSPIHARFLWFLFPVICFVFRQSTSHLDMPVQYPLGYATGVVESIISDHMLRIKFMSSSFGILSCAC